MVWNPPGLSEYTSYFSAVLSLAGVLLGLAFAALLYVIQSGLQSFTYSRRMFLEIYATFARTLLGSLSYVVLISLAVLYLKPMPRVTSWIYYIFAAYFTKAYLDFHKHQGYMKTIFSTKFVPSTYGPLRRYFRYILNLGPIRVVWILVTLFIFVGYPICLAKVEHDSFALTHKSLFYSSLIVICYSVVRIANFITEFFYLSKEELEFSPETEGQKESEENVQEKRILKDYLFSHGLKELDPVSEIAFCKGTLRLELLENNKSPEAWFNVHVKTEKATVFEIRREVCRYAYKLFDLLSRSMVDLNSFVLSFHIRVSDENIPRNIFFRTNRRELKGIISEVDRDAEEVVMKIKNKLFDDLFRNLDQGEPSANN